MKTTPILTISMAAACLALVTISLKSVFGQSTDPTPPGVSSPSGSGPRPIIRSIQIEGTNVVLVVSVPEGVRRIVLESRPRAESGAWVSRELRWPDGRSGSYSFVIPRSKDLEILRISSADTNALPLPASVYQGEAASPGAGEAEGPVEAATPSDGTPVPGDSPPGSPPTEPPPPVVLQARVTPNAKTLATRHGRQRESVAAASRAKDLPERLSPDFPPKPFLTVAYAKNPDAYLEVIEPGRCWQTAPDESQAPTLSVFGGRAEIEVPAHSSAELSLVVPAGAPATFTSFGGGTFPNTLNSITVEAGADGRATTTWTASAGTVQEALIVAGSPLTRGTAQFRLTVQGPTTAPRLAITPRKKGGAR